MNMDSYSDHTSSSSSSVEQKTFRNKRKNCIPRKVQKTEHSENPHSGVCIKLFAKKTLQKYVARKYCPQNSENRKVRNGKELYKKVQPYKCAFCYKGFTFSSNLKRHTKLFHQNYSRPGRRSKAINAEGKNQIGQNLKSKEYNNAIEENTDLVNHIKIHWYEKPYECTTCGLRFHFKSGIRRHMSVHTKEKPFSCSMCNNTFTRSSSLYKHMRRIHQEDFTLMPSGPQDQNDADKNTTPVSLVLDEDLAKLTRIHSGELKPFECITCHKRFYEKTELRRHLRVHSGEKPYPCKHCDKTFGSSGNLYSHLRRMHYELCKDLYNFRPPPTSSVPHSAWSKRSKSSSSTVQSANTAIFPQNQTPTTLNQYDKCYKCNFCHETFGSENEMRHHAKIHQGSQSHKCYFCNKFFSHLGNMHVHMRLLHNYVNNETTDLYSSQMESTSSM